MNSDFVKEFGPDWATATIEINIDTVKSTYGLPDDSLFRQSEVLAIGVVGNPLGTAKSASGRPLVKEGAIYSSWLHLKAGGNEVLGDHPMSDLLLSKERCCYRYLRKCNLNPSKSQVIVGDPSLLTAGESIVLVYIYRQ